ncbi:MAG: alpha/beta hydrolase [Acidimicrobiia bacterium]|nr:alpha/beta hydrolase [Acidimicrobiia bacterium]
MGNVSTGDTELFVDVRGSGPPLVLVHGFTGTHEDWMDHVDWLAESWRVVTYDHRGHGRSGRTDRYSLDLLRDDLAVLLDALDVGPAVLLGHSMGGMVVQELALRDPARATALVLMDTVGGPLILDEHHANLADMACKIAVEHGMQALLAAQKAVAANDDAELLGLGDPEITVDRPGYEDWCDAKLLATDPAAYASLLAEMRTQRDRHDLLAHVDAPTLVICGEHDTGMRRASRRLAEAVPGAELVWLPEAAHSGQFEDPERWREAVGGFLDRVRW